MSTYASALAYRGLFAMFPFLVFLIALLGFLDLQNFSTGCACSGAGAAAGGNGADQSGHRPVAGTAGRLAVVRYSGGVVDGFHRLSLADECAYDVEEGRPTWKLIILALAYTAGVAVLLLFTAG